MHNPQPARLGDITEANYHRHVTMRAAALGIPERDLAAHIEWAAMLNQLRGEMRGAA